MADKTQKALNLADQGVKLAEQFMSAVEEFEALLEIASDSSINMVQFDTAISAVSNIMHVDGATFNKLGTNAIPNIVTAIETANSAGTGLTIRQLLNQLRAGK